MMIFPWSFNFFLRTFLCDKVLNCVGGEWFLILIEIIAIVSNTNTKIQKWSVRIHFDFLINRSGWSGWSGFNLLNTYFCDCAVVSAKHLLSSTPTTFGKFYYSIYHQANNDNNRYNRIYMYATAGYRIALAWKYFVTPMFIFTVVKTVINWYLIEFLTSIVVGFHTSSWEHWTRLMFYLLPSTQWPISGTNWFEMSRQRIGAERKIS